MARPSGSKNENFTQTKQTLIGRVRDALLQPGAAQLSFRQMADAAGISPTTLRHYFVNRDQLVREVFKTVRQDGLPFMHEAAMRSFDDVRQSLRWFLGYVLEGWRQGLGAVHQLGLSVGLGHADLGPAYIDEILEPTLQVAEVRLARHVADGELGPCQVRFAAIALVSPLVVALLHQENLGGARCRPLDMAAFIEEHIERFLRAHQKV